MAVFFTSLDRDAGVGWVGQRSFWRPQNSFLSFFGHDSFQSTPLFCCSKWDSNRGLPDLKSDALRTKLSNLTVIADWKKLIFIGVGLFLLYL